MSASREQQDLLQEIAQALQDDGPVAVGTMFRSPALRTGKKVVAFLGSGPGDTLKADNAGVDRSSGAE
jgi:hypothetical protein